MKCFGGFRVISSLFDFGNEVAANFILPTEPDAAGRGCGAMAVGLGFGDQGLGSRFGA